jgi:hypothetical protein
VGGLLDQGYAVRESEAGTKTETPLIELPATVESSTGSSSTRRSS